MKRGRQFGNTARAADVAKQERMDPRLDGEIDDDRAAGRDAAEVLREAVRETEPLGAFDARAIRELYKAAPADPKGLRRTIRGSELRQIVPLADSMIYELERRGDFPQRFFLTARCVVWGLREVLAWIESRRAARSRGVKKAPAPDVRKRIWRPIRSNYLLLS
jgi:prophage regulatory protein